MSNSTPIINILTYQLPFELANQIYNEYQDRLRESRVLMEKYKKYSRLKDSMSVVETFLALSIFYRRVIANFDGAVKFYNTVVSKGNTDTILIGKYQFTGEERNKMLAVVMSYYGLLDRFSISPLVLEYLETRYLLQNLLILKDRDNV